MRAVTVIDDRDITQGVIGVLLVKPIDVTIDDNGTMEWSRDTPEPEREATKRALFWSFWGDNEPVALLVSHGRQLIPFEGGEVDDRPAIFAGEIRYADTPRLGGRRAVRLSRSAMVVESDGKELRTFSAHTELIAEGTIELPEPISDEVFER